MSGSVPHDRYHAGRIAAGGGQLVLTNFSATHPINVMFVGDSITDDCQTDGAWRSDIQRILDTNNFPWRAVGRWASPVNSTNVNSATFGSYTLLVSNAWGSLTSSAAILTAGAPPSITTQPAPLVVLPGSNAIF